MMNIGEKIKNLRTSKLMTQKELAGDVITRNMLSRIENGAALPSLQSLIYLANRLGVQPGYLLSDGDANEMYYKKYANYPNIISSFKSEEWEICRDLCLSCYADGSDNEITYMLAYAAYHIGCSGFYHGELKKAAKMFEEALEYSALTVFDVGSIVSCIKTQVEFMSKISPTLTIDVPNSDSASVCLCDICKFSDCFMGIKSYKDLEWSNVNYHHALVAIDMVDNGNYEAAIGLLSQICEDNSLPKPIIYFILDDLEKSCKETEDYKGAYEVSQNKLQLFEKMLADA
ncbi:MAG: helix-turn-helix transcriptional regulator [Clostridia bacterium]|nr:helix-turn-helix transcriptional regulator [Clostridia bacterium]